MDHFECRCGNTLFFENTVCLQCCEPVGYDIVSNAMGPIEEPHALCRNGREFGVCNWVVPADEPEYCAACCLNRTVPDLSAGGNLEAWRKMESAKRRVIYTLARLGIQPRSKDEDVEGLVFEFLASSAGQHVLTGHEDGIITLNILEADDSYRERERHRLGEPYRTLVGHFRHELGHYYWDRFFLSREEDDPLRLEFQTMFGDDRLDYPAALQQYYKEGPPVAWPTTHVTAYATAHPWEDWAETWAHYLHIIEGLETAEAFGWASDDVPIPFTPFLGSEALAESDGGLLSRLNRWAKLSPALNEIAASLGYANFYPFVLSTPVVKKLIFVHHMVTGAAAVWKKPKAAAAAQVQRKTAVAA